MAEVLGRGAALWEFEAAGGAAPAATGLNTAYYSVSGSNVFGPDAFGAAAAGRTITVRLVDRNGSPQTGVTGIYWAILSGLPASATILAQGTGETTDGSGNLVIDATSSGLSIGASAWLLITDGAAAPDTKGRVFPVTVA